MPEFHQAAYDLTGIAGVSRQAQAPGKVTHRAMTRYVLIATLTGALAVVAGAGLAETPDATSAPSSSQRELVIGTKEAPPFSMKEVDGSWHGISIDLWRHVAEQLHLHYRFVEVPNVEGLIDGVAARKFDVAVAALTVTAARARTIDFTQPFYGTGLGIAVPAGRGPSWLPLLRTLTSFGLAQAIVALAGLALAAGMLIWAFERRHNDDFSGSATKGLTAGVWWSTVAMTQRHGGSISPKTLPGRFVAIVWMVVSVVAIAVFTASVTSALTIKHLEGTVHGVNDLRTVRVGAVAGTSTEDALSRLSIRYRKYAAPQDGLKALRAHSIDAFVYDKPILAWIIQNSFSSSIVMIDTTFDPQQYAFAVPRDSSLGRALTVAVLDAIHSEWWRQTTFRYLESR
jgi:ABC-type amino acid transport substrate-binding protein